MIADTPKTPSFAVMFTSIRTAIDNVYGNMTNKMVEPAKHQEGFLGVESTRNEKE